MSEWIEWIPQGKYEGPLEDHIWCEVLMLDGERDQAFACNFNWGVEDEPGEIVAYRVSEIQDCSSEFKEILEENLDKCLA